MNITQTDLVDFIHVTQETELEEVLNLLQNTKTKELAFDTETAAILDIPNSSALDRHTAKVEMIQLMSMEWNCPILIDVSILGVNKCRPIIEIIDNQFLAIAFNAKFDIQQIRSTFGIYLTNVHCAQVCLKLIGGATGFKASKQRGNSYKAFCRDLFKVFLDKAEATSNWASKTKTEEQLQYAALDVGAPKELEIKSLLLEGYFQLKDLIINQYDMEEIFYVEQENVVAMSDTEYVGMPINITVLNTFLNTTVQELEQLKLSIAKKLKLEIRQKLVKENEKVKRVKYITSNTNKILNSPQALPPLLNNFLSNTDIQIENIQGTTISGALSLLEEEQQFKEEKELLEEIILYKNLSKLIDKNWDVLINPISQCIHPNFNTIGASTGRMSSSAEGGSSKFNAQSLAKRNVLVELTEEQFSDCNSRVMT